MENVSDSNPAVPEGSRKASIPDFPWFNLGDFLSATPPRTTFSTFRASQTNQNPGVVVQPIRYISLTSETAKSNNNETTPTKVRKTKTSKKTSVRDESKVLGPNKFRSRAKKKKGHTMPDEKHEKNPNIGIDITSIDFSSLPSPVCSCTGTARVCYKWGTGGWQSSCCTPNLSEYPLPASPMKHGCRLAGRKMSQGAYGKLLMRLAEAGHDLSVPVDLKEHWAKHGTNKFITIK